MPTRWESAAVANAYNVANVAPNIIYDLLLGGILTSIVVPVLVRAARDDADGGVDFARSLLTLIAITLGIAVVIGMVAAPLIINLYLDQGGAEHDLAVTFLRWFLPQVIFYGIGAAIGAILNIRGRFGAPMFTPVLNNVIVIATAVAFVLMSGGEHPTLAGITTAQTTVLAAGTTLGVVVMTVALLPSLRRTGFRYRPRLNLRHPGLLQAGRLAGWMFLYVLVTQLAYLFVIRLASGATAFPTYSYAFQLFQLPYAIVAVSVITALLPRMSRHSADDRKDLVREDLSHGMRLNLLVIVPAALGLIAIGRPLAYAVYAHGAVSGPEAYGIGNALVAFAVGLDPVLDVPAAAPRFLRRAEQPHADAGHDRRRRPSTWRRCTRCRPCCPTRRGRWRSRSPSTSRTRPARSRSPSCCAGNCMDWTGGGCSGCSSGWRSPVPWLPPLPTGRCR